VLRRMLQRPEFALSPVYFLLSTFLRIPQ
jgi:hypothetical protein